MMRNSIPCFGIIRIRCKGFDLSLSFNPQADKAPLLVSPAKIRFFSIRQSKTYKIAKITEECRYYYIYYFCFQKTSFAFSQEWQRGVSILGNAAG